MSNLPATFYFKVVQLEMWTAMDSYPFDGN